MPPRKGLALIEDILVYARIVGRAIGDRSSDALLADEFRLLAVERAMEVIGEAVK